MALIVSLLCFVCVTPQSPSTQHPFELCAKFGCWCADNTANHRRGTGKPPAANETFSATRWHRVYHPHCFISMWAKKTLHLCTWISMNISRWQSLCISRVLTWHDTSVNDATLNCSRAINPTVFCQRHDIVFVYTIGPNHKPHTIHHANANEATVVLCQHHHCATKWEAIYTLHYWNDTPILYDDIVVPLIRIETRRDRTRPLWKWRSQKGVASSLPASNNSIEYIFVIWEECLGRGCHFECSEPPHSSFPTDDDRTINNYILRCSNKSC